MSVEAKLDKRSQRTRERLRQALVTLTLQGDYESMTIRELTQEAGVGYNTFFRHYTDKDDLRTDVLTELVVKMAPLFLPPGEMDAPLLNPTRLFEFVAEQADLTRVLLISGTEQFEKRVRQMILQGELLEFHRLFYAGGEHTAEQKLRLELSVTHLVSSMLTLVRWWLEQDMNLSPREMGRLTMNLIGEPLRIFIVELLGLEDPYEEESKPSL